MGPRRYRSQSGGREFAIEEDKPEVGAYLYVYENGKCIRDYLQNTVEIAKSFALKKFDVKLESWEEIP